MSPFFRCFGLLAVLFSSPTALAQVDSAGEEHPRAEAPRLTPEQAARMRVVNRLFQEMDRAWHADQRERDEFQAALYRLCDRAGFPVVEFLIPALAMLLDTPENRADLVTYLAWLSPEIIAHDPRFFRDLRRLLQQFETLGNKPILRGECPPDMDPHSWPCKKE